MDINNSVGIGGKLFKQVKTLTGTGEITREIDATVAKAGTLTTRTDNDTGTITMSASGHGITTGARVDIYWTGGSRRGVTVGTVSGTTVPIDLGAGDNLPIATTALTVAVATAIEFLFTGSNVTGIAFYTAGAGTFVLTDSSDVELYKRILADDGQYGWFNGNGDASPISGAFAKLYMTQGGVASTKKMRVGVVLS